MTETNVLIATPCYQGSMLSSMAKSVMNLMQVLAGKGISCEFFTIDAESLIPRGRNACVAYFLSKGTTEEEKEKGIKQFTHLLFLDADITFSPENVLRLIEHNKPVSGCAYPKKAYNWKKVAASTLQALNWEKLRESIASGKDKKEIIEEQVEKIGNGDILLRSMDYVYNLKAASATVKEGWLQVSEIGTGFMLVSRSAIDTLIEKHPEMKYINDVTGYDQMHPAMKDNFYLFFDCRCEPAGDSQRYLSEDYAFCHLCEAANLEIWLDTTATVHHTGNHTFPGNLFMSLKMKAQDEGRI